MTHPTNLPSKPRALIALILALTMALSGCLGAQDTLASDDMDGDGATASPDAQADGSGSGTSDPTTEETPGEAPAEENQQEQAQPPARVIKHDLGKTTIEGKPLRVVALEWNFIETLLALGVQPIGVADKEGFEEWVDIGVQLDGSVANVGTRAEPSLEKIASLEPDLILGIKFRHAAIYDELSSIAPTLVYEMFPARDSGFTQFTKMEHTVRGVARAMALDADGERVLQDMHAHLDQTKAQLGGMKMTDREMILTQLFTTQGAPVLRVFTDNSIVVHVAHRIGLTNAWPHDYEQYGFSTVSMEALAPVQHADFFYVAQSDDNPVKGQWRKNPVWLSYEFVKEDRVFPLGEKTWLFPGPLGVERVADRMLENYQAWAS